MQKCAKMHSYKFWLLVGCAISVIILLFEMCPQMRLPCPFDFVDVDTLNEIIEGLAISFLMGTLVFYLTVIQGAKLRRNVMRWELYDAIAPLHDALEQIEKEIGVKFCMIKLLDYENYYTEEIAQKTEYSISEFVKGFHPYRGYLTDQEEIWLSNVITNSVIAPYCAGMQEKNVKMNTAKLRQLCSDINELYSSINKNTK